MPKIFVWWWVVLKVNLVIGFGLGQAKQQLMKLDNINSVLFCQCPPDTSFCKDCLDDCKAGAHIESFCPKVKKIPVINLLLIRKQLNRVKEALDLVWQIT